MIRPTAVALAAALLAACSPNEGQAPMGAAQAQEQQQPGGAASANKGKVLQVTAGGGYTYAEVQLANGAKIWVAGQQIDVKPGSEVSWGNAMVMRDFTSRSLGRTFAEILFVESWGGAGSVQVATAPHGSLPQPSLHQGGAAAPAGASESGVVKSVTNAGGYSYIEVDRGGAVVWVAAMETPLKRGDKVQWSGTEMSNFTARSLGRTFEKITFAQGVQVLK